MNEIGDEGVGFVEERLMLGDVLVGDVSRVMRNYLLELRDAKDVPVQSSHYLLCQAVSCRFAAILGPCGLLEFL